MKCPILFSFILALVTLPMGAQPFEFKDGDRVAFVGAGLIEQEVHEGFIETALVRANLGEQIAFRNFGWTGDAVGQDSKQPVRMTRPPKMPTFETYFQKFNPTVVIVSYGQMEVFDGLEKIPAFIKNYETWLALLAGQNRRIIVLSPIREENLGGNFPEINERNKNLELYVQAIQKLCQERNFLFVNLFQNLKPQPGEQLTVNAVQLSALGYARAARAIADSLGQKPLNFSEKTTDPIREAIKHKNQLFWYHYKPQNYEYIYGSRIGNQAGLPDEVNEFAELAVKADQTIASLGREIYSGGSGSFQRPVSKDFYQPVAGNVEADQKALRIKEGFEVNLFAADPNIQKPVALAWDARGRLWLSTTTIYPQIRPGQRPSDRIIILEDSNHDGIADKSTVFVDDLYMPTGLIPVKGGCYVFDEVSLFFLSDDDGDDKADSKRVLLSGFGAEDNHHKGHTLRWSPDGRIHFQQGIFLHTTVETTYGILQHLKAGIFQFEPDSGRFDLHLANSIPPNPWGHYWNEWGQDFHIDSSGQQGSTFIIPTAGNSSAHLVVPGGNAKLAGAEILSGRHFGTEYEGDLVSPPFKENRVAHWKFSDDSSGYALKQVEPLIVSSNGNFRPVDPRMGPDGALYIADWYNPLIGHMQHHLNDPARDHFRGRIWRVTRKGAAPLPVINFAKLSIAECLEHLKDPEQHNRNMARRVLVEFNAAREVVPSALKWVSQLPPIDLKTEHHRMEVLWLFQNLRHVDSALVKSLLKSPDANARAAATAVFRDPFFRKKMPEALDLLAIQAADESPRVRLQTVVSLSYFQEPKAIEMASIVVDQPLDRYIEQALIQTSQALKSSWISAFKKGELNFGGNTKRKNHILQVSGMTGRVGPIVNTLLEKKIPLMGLEQALEVVADEASPEQLFELHRAPLESQVLAKTWAAVTRAVRQRKLPFKADNNELREKLLGGATDGIVAEAAKLAGAVRNDYVRREVRDLAEKSGSSIIQAGAMEGLAYYGGESEMSFLKNSAADAKELNTRVAATVALAQVDSKSATTSILRLLSSKDLDQDSISRLVQPFLNRPKGAETLAASLAEGKLDRDAARLILRLMQASGRQEPNLTALMTEAAGFASETRELGVPEMRALMAEVKSKGNPEKGEKIFRRPELACMQCHAMAGAGGTVGPDLSATGSGSTLDYLIDSIISPSKTIKEGYEPIEVSTKDDELVVGVRVRENANDLVLKDAARPEIVISKNRISERKEIRSSLMPSGLANYLTHDEFVDLMRFLSELGKPGPFAHQTERVVRRWQVWVKDGRNDGSWTPVYSLVNGTLPVDEIPAGKVRFQLEVTTPGKILLKSNRIEGLSFLVDGKPFPTSEELVLGLERGLHDVEILLHPSRKESIRMELDEVLNSPGRAQLVGGK